MSNSSSPASRFRQFRERAGLSHDDVARASCVSSPSIWDIENHDHELSSGYSPGQALKFAQIFGIRPIEFFIDNFAEPPISAAELVRLIHEHCQSRGITLAQFEEIVGWHLSACIEPPEHLLEDISIDGLQWLCKELGVDWRRVILSL